MDNCSRYKRDLLSGVQRRGSTRHWEHGAPQRAPVRGAGDRARGRAPGLRWQQPHRYTNRYRGDFSQLPDRWRHKYSGSRYRSFYDVRYILYKL